MALTPEFISAVNAGNMLRIRIILKDSLLVDKSFAQFREMSAYAQKQGVNFWMNKTEELTIAPKEEWDVTLMNLELTTLVNDFTKERLSYCQSIIRSVYKITLNAELNHNCKPNKEKNEQKKKKVLSKNSVDDYGNIIKSAGKIQKILEQNKSRNGDRNWLDADVDTIYREAANIYIACKNIKSRRKR